jgi:hypothetical protein
MNDQNALTVQALSANVNVGMNEVVSVFVSKYETGLFEKKDDLSDKIKVVKQELTDIDKAVKATVSVNDYRATVPAFGLTFSVSSIDVSWSAKSVIKVHVDMTEKGVSYSRWSKTIEVKIDDEYVTKHNEAEKRVAELSAELLEVMGLIKSVSRKERQIRGHISELKLAESGLSSLLNDSAIMKLIEVK